MYLKFTGTRCWRVFRHTFVINRTGFHETGGDSGQLSTAQLDFTRLNRHMSVSGTPTDLQYCRQTIVNVGFREVGSAYWNSALSSKAVFVAGYSEATSLTVS